ncbi:MAG: hypothetical protein AAF363_19710 [Bacteroidota bacterium]
MDYTVINDPPCIDGQEKFTVELVFDKDTYPLLKAYKSEHHCIESRPIMVSFYSEDYRHRDRITAFSPVLEDKPQLKVTSSDFKNHVSNTFIENDYGLMLDRLEIFETSIGTIAEKRYEVQNKTYVDLYYDEIFYNQLDPLQLNLVILHELAHLAIDHLHSSTGKGQEIQADEWAGRKFAKKYIDEIDFERFEELLNDLFKDYDNSSISHPSKEERIKAFKNSWIDIERQRNIDLAEEKKEQLDKFQSIAYSTNQDSESETVELQQLKGSINDFDSLISLIDLRLGEIKYYNQKYEEARPLIESYLIIHPDSYEKQFLLAKILLSIHESITNYIQNKFQIVIDNCNDESLVSEVYYTLGKQAYSENKLDAAKEYFSESIKSDSSNTLPYIKLISLLKEGDTDLVKLISLTEKAVFIEESQLSHQKRLQTLKSYFYEILLNLYKEAKSSNSIDLYNQIIKVNLNGNIELPLFNFHLGIAHFKNNNFKQAIDYLNKIDPIDETNKKRKKEIKGIAYYRLMNYDSSYYLLDEIGFYGFEHLYSGLKTNKNDDLYQVYSKFENNNIDNDHFYHYLGLEFVRRKEYCLAANQLILAENKKLILEDDLLSPNLLAHLRDVYNKGRLIKVSEQKFVILLNDNPKLVKDKLCNGG